VSSICENHHYGSANMVAKKEKLKRKKKKEKKKRRKTKREIKTYSCSTW
jgi:hypothetical protein